MKKVLRWLGIMLSILIALGVIASVTVLSIGRARFYETISVDVPLLAIPTDEAAVARGEHLVTAITHCGSCHGDDLAGEIVLNRPNAQGVIVAPNLTAGTGGLGATYTSEDWVRTIRHGVTRSGRSVILMPSILFNDMSEADLAAVIAYLGTIPPVDKVLPETQPGPLFYLLIGAGPLRGALSGHVIDHQAAFTPGPAEAETAAYGQYLVTLGQCVACHGPELAGGQGCRDCPIGPNLTQGGELQGWIRNDFDVAMRTGRHPDGRQLDDVMPWRNFQFMSDTDLAAIWRYLEAQPALASQLP